LTLVDARHLSDSRYAEHETFQQQMAIADVIVVNKRDLYCEQDQVALKAYLQEHSLSNVKLVFAEHGVIEHSLLEGQETMTPDGTVVELPSSTDDNNQRFNTPIPECGFIKALNHGEGFVSVGWRFSPRFEFDRNKLFAFLSGMNVERLKATFITNDGCFAYNLTKDALAEISFEHFEESRIEIIAGEQNRAWEKGLFDCMCRDTTN